MERIIYHIDVNSAFLSWTAVDRPEQDPHSEDLRLIPSVVGGSEASRHGIVLAKSIPAKKYGIKTGEALVSARSKCPGLITVPPDYPLYVNASREFVRFLRRYAPAVEQYSIDEVFCDMTGTKALYGYPVVFAHELKEMIKDRFWFTVNIGVGNNKLMAKMASDFEKPDKVHTLFQHEINKMWSLPVGDLFFVGPATKRKLYNLGIHTIYELAHTPVEVLVTHLKKHGRIIWEFANGYDVSSVTLAAPANKGYGNSMTLAKDVITMEDAKQVLLSLCETTCTRIRADKAYISVVSVSIADNEFWHVSSQLTLPSATSVTERVYATACTILKWLWHGEPIRQLGVHTSKAMSSSMEQYDLFSMNKIDKYMV